jgi:hypothetical protein
MPAPTPSSRAFDVAVFQVLIESGCSASGEVIEPFPACRRWPCVGQIGGTTKLLVAALVELVPNCMNTAEVLVAAELEHRSWGVRRYRAQLTPTPHTIVLAE